MLRSIMVMQFHSHQLGLKLARLLAAPLTVGLAVCTSAFATEQIRTAPFGSLPAGAERVLAPEIQQLVAGKVIAIHTPFHEGWEVHLRGKYAFTSCCGGETGGGTWFVEGNDRNVLCFHFRNSDASCRGMARTANGLLLYGRDVSDTQGEWWPIDLR
jgi:hypothetical protein